MDFQEKAARNELPILLERVPELRNFPESEQVRMIIESRKFDRDSVKILIGGLLLLAIILLAFWFLPTLSPEIEQFMSVRRGGVVVALLLMAPLIFIVIRLQLSRQVKKLRAMIAEKG